VPPLRTRKDDIIPLLEDFTYTLSPSAGKIISFISGELEKYLCGYSWPGNIRELENVARTLVASINPGDPPLKLITLIVDSLNRKCLRAKPASPPEPAPPPPPPSPALKPLPANRYRMPWPSAAAASPARRGF
jgi:DNA-binding NtrC family response regulator